MAFNMYYGMHGISQLALQRCVSGPHFIPWQHPDTQKLRAPRGVVAMMRAYLTRGAVSIQSRKDRSTNHIRQGPMCK